jgi:hypothetical protein
MAAKGTMTMAKRKKSTRNALTIHQIAAGMTKADIDPKHPKKVIKVKKETVLDEVANRIGSEIAEVGDYLLDPRRSCRCPEEIVTLQQLLNTLEDGAGTVQELIDELGEDTSLEAIYDEAA